MFLTSFCLNLGCKKSLFEMLHDFDIRSLLTKSTRGTWRRLKHLLQPQGGKDSSKKEGWIEAELSLSRVPVVWMDSDDNDEGNLHPRMIKVNLTLLKGMEYPLWLLLLTLIGRKLQPMKHSRKWG